MKKTRLRMAALAIGGALTLLLPVTAAARDRDDHRGGDRDHGRVEQHFDRDRHDTDVRRNWDRGRDDFRFNVNIGGPAYRIVTPGYYDQFGYWHAPVYQYY